MTMQTRKRNQRSQDGKRKRMEEEEKDKTYEPSDEEMEEEEMEAPQPKKIRPTSRAKHSPIGKKEMLETCIEEELLVRGQCAVVEIRIVNGKTVTMNLILDFHHDTKGNLVITLRTDKGEEWTPEPPADANLKEVGKCDADCWPPTNSSLMNYICHNWISTLQIYIHATGRRISIHGRRSVYENLTFVFRNRKHPSMTLRLRLYEIMDMKSFLVDWLPEMSPHHQQHERYAQEALEAFEQATEANDDDESDASDNENEEDEEDDERELASGQLMTADNFGPDQEQLERYNIPMPDVFSDFQLALATAAATVSLPSSDVIQDLISGNMNFSFGEEQEKKKEEEEEEEKKNEQEKEEEYEDCTAYMDEEEEQEGPVDQSFLVDNMLPELDNPYYYGTFDNNNLYDMEVLCVSAQ